MPFANVLSPDAQATVRVQWSRDAEHVQVVSAPMMQGHALTDDQRYVDLDRAGINLLIRALRDARDHAFGRDA